MERNRLDLLLRDFPTSNSNSMVLSHFKSLAYTAAVHLRRPLSGCFSLSLPDRLPT